LKAAPAGIAPVTTSRLGDWCANLIHVGHQQLVLAVSEKTLLPVVVLAAPNTTLIPRLRVAVADVLRALGISRGDIDPEDAAMAESVYGTTTNRQVLGILVDFAQGIPYYLDAGGSLLGVSVKLAERAPHSSRPRRARTARRGHYSRGRSPVRRRAGIPEPPVFAPAPLLTIVEPGALTKQREKGRTWHRRVMDEDEV
jgi:hypothetical protein